uniref:TRP C-terminal domain-containing protein n=1 Tax=Amphimedon queenslandica TaxID=400682 RepID=A0A1X7U823_AMPQE
MILSIFLTALLLGSVSTIDDSGFCGTPGCTNHPCKKPPACHKCCPGICSANNELRCHQLDNGGSMTTVGKWNGVQLEEIELSDSTLSQFLTTNTTFLYGHCIQCRQLGPDFEVKVSKPTVVVARDNEFIDLCKNNTNNESFLCSECDSGFYHNRRGDCVSCSNLAMDWFIFIVSQIVPSTALFLSLYATGFDMISGGLNSAIFFAQMITTTMDITGSGYIPISNITDSPQTSQNLIGAYQFLYDVWNLEFFSPFSKKLCLFHVDSFLVYFVVEYIIAFYPIAILAFVALVRAICRRVRKRNNSRYWDNSMHNLAMSVFVLSYSKLAVTSMMLIFPVKIYDIGDQYVRTVSLFDPSIEYVSIPYVLFVIIALLVVFILFLYPILLLLMQYLRDYRESNVCLGLDKFFRLFLNDDGAFDEKRVLEAIFLLLRVILLIVRAIPFIFAHQFIIEQGILLIGALAISFFPNRKHMRFVDMFMLVLLVFINTLSIYQYAQVEGSQPLSVSVFYTQYSLVFIPEIWIIVYFVAHFAKWLKRKLLRSCCCPAERTQLLDELSVQDQHK